MKISVQRVKEIIREEMETLNEGNDQFMHILKIHGFKKHGKPWAGHYFFKGPNGYYATLNPKARYLDISKGNRSVHNGYAWTSLVRFFAKHRIKRTDEGKLTEGKRVQLKIPIRDRKKVVNILQKKLRLKIMKDFDYGGSKGSYFFVDLDKKFYNKVLELLIKNRIKVHGT